MTPPKASLTPAAAHKIASALLQETGDAMMRGDFPRFAKCFLLPQELETPAGRRLIHTRQELHSTFDTIRALHKRDRIAQIVRHCVEAAFRDENTIASTHESRSITHDLVLLNRPYPAFSILKLVDGHWKIAFTRYEVQDSPELMSALTNEPSSTL